MSDNEFINVVTAPVGTDKKLLRFGKLVAPTTQFIESEAATQKNEPVKDEETTKANESDVEWVVVEVDDINNNGSAAQGFEDDSTYVTIEHDDAEGAEDNVCDEDLCQLILSLYLEYLEFMIKAPSLR